MLENLHVKNLALIEEEDITFLDGLHILSGETGAGKSIILGALGLALGGKAPKEMLRDNEQEALVEAVFRVTSDRQRQELMEADVSVYDDQVILSRRISETRSVAKINGETVPANKLKQVGSMFIDIYGQQEHQSLIHKKKHLELIDDYAKAEIGQLKSELKSAYKEYVEKKQELDSANMDESSRLREISFLEHEIEEISSASLKVGEDEELEAKYKKMSNSKRIMEALGIARNNTSDTGGASDMIGRAVRELMMAANYDSDIESLSGMLSEVENLLGDFNRELADYMSDAEFDGEVFADIESRLNSINRLKDKYGSTIELILETLDEKVTRVDKLRSFEDYYNNLKLECQMAQDRLEELSLQLSIIRKENAKKFSKLLQQALQDLNFLDVQFDTKFERLSDYTMDGIDDVEFMISTNPGEALKPLKDIASGGEMSRVMLGIRTVMAENDNIDTLIFDEIDAGISGRTAQAVSEKLKMVSKGHQVICITHLPQIAAMADQHYLIEKSVLDGSTISSIQALDYHDSVKELARMLGGAEITQTVLDNAKEMKDLAMTM
ncbi:MAG: DNA repair protein RecN [Lachnospiraceae bacterium]|nr:DNA repair protein RecN [Lachnospiraceae bacterium]